jgi:predicted lipoprotein with Yx(FWY)xxD motif
VHTFRRSAPALGVLAALALAGCGSSSSSSSSAGGTGAAAPTSSSTSGAARAYGAAPASSSSSSAAEAQPAALITTKHAKLGTILAFGPKHMTVYMFEADKGGHSACSAACAQGWPPVTGKPSAAGAAVSGDLGTIKRADGSTQVTYKGHPLYMFIKDKDSADAYGQGSHAFGAGWYVLKPSGAKIDKS